jgi:membrane-bound serine protease (ClpP class)
MMKIVFRAVFLIFVLIGLLFGCKGGSAEADGNEIVVLRVEGNIVPIVADYIIRGIREAEERGSEACIIELNTPGGLLDTTEKIVRCILNADVPVVVYVSPQGAWAASAGTFITVSAHLSAMAPATSIGAAHPVSVGEEMPEAQQKKATEYSAAWIQSIAEKRGRNPALVEAAVRESKSFTASQAVESNLVDFMADDLGTVIKRINGREITLSNGRKVTVNTTGAHIRYSEMTGVEKFLHMISHPNVAYILLSLASIGLITEVSNPGLIFPGVIGGICLFFAFYSLGVLNAYWAGLLLILLALGLFVTEIFVPSYGILTTGGIISLVIGSFTLFSGSDASMQVDPGIIVVTTVVLVAFVGFLIWATVRGQRRKVATGKEGMIGQIAIVKAELNPRGKVLIDGELWTAEIESGTALPGEEVVIKRVDDLKLYVDKLNKGG